MSLSSDVPLPGTNLCNLLVRQSLNNRNPSGDQAGPSVNRRPTAIFSTLMPLKSWATTETADKANSAGKKVQFRTYLNDTLYGNANATTESPILLPTLP
jgi:hypothetical protein